MPTNFEKIPAEEQQRILEICLAEFADKSYQRASTNAIVKAAGIPKGTLFYYFGSKKDLYLYLIDHAVDTYIDEAHSKLQDLPVELFERLFYMHEVRMKFVLQHPTIYQLLFNAFLNTPEEIMPQLQERTRRYAALAGARRLHGLDCSKFREGVDVEKAIELVSLVSEGLFNRYLPALKRTTTEGSLVLVEKIGDEVKDHFELIKSGIYK